ncbi:hypothetical protein [Gemmiger formicilis]|uniref:hypothetical protein n=1 Tax=Gemmiger formicilis TaxID=745368 RepID=UPI003520807B
MKKINGSVIQDGFFAMKTAKGLQTAKTICNPFHIIICYFHGKIVRQKSFSSLPCITNLCQNPQEYREECSFWICRDCFPCLWENGIPESVPQQFLSAKLTVPAWRRPLVFRDQVKRLTKYQIAQRY